MKIYVVDQRSDGAYDVYDEVGASRLRIAATVPESASQDRYTALTAHVCAALPDAEAVITIERSVRPGAGIRQHTASSTPCTIVELGAALVELIPETVDRFAFVAAGGERITLLTLDASRRISHISEGDCGAISQRDLDFASSLGYDYAIFEAPLASGIHGAGTTIHLSRDRVHAAARTVASRKQTDSGVWIRDAEAGTTLTMALERRIAFDVVQTRLPIFSLENHTLAVALGNREALFIVDERVDAIYGEPLRAYARHRLKRAPVETIRALETEKTLDRAAHICRLAIEHALPRNGVFVAVGGGVTLDLVGSAAAMHRRGSAFMRIPTTLVGMIDVCVGVKQGVNDGDRKNILGAYHIPLCGLNDARFLATLPDCEIAAGLAEIIKVALILDPRLFALLEAHVEDFFAKPFRETAPMLEIIVRAKAAMMRELQKNLWEEDLRRWVDFGHTFSSSIETTSRYTVSHGLAVALDMAVSTALAVDMGCCDAGILSRLIALYERVGLPVVHPACTLDVLVKGVPGMRLHRAGNLNLVVPTGIGSGTFVQDVTRDALAAALRMVESTVREPAIA
jgi:3-dehydroquinate synthase